MDALLKTRLARIPLGFMGDGRDTANAALFLASDEARFITGTEIIAHRTPTAATVSVRGLALSVLPGMSPSITQSATVPVERLTR